MGKSTQTSETSKQTDPWTPQAGALQSAFNNAQSAYNTASTATAPDNYVAQYTPEQLATYRSALDYANNSNIPALNAASGGALSSAGTNATTGALSGLAGFDPTKLNNPEALIGAANQYVAGQDIDGQVNNAMLNARQTARDVTLPGIEQNAAISGNTNSSRTGIAEGLVERGLAQQATDLGATLRSNAFKDGLTLASSNANANNASSLGALSSLASSGLGAASAGIGANSQSINDKNNLLGIAEGAGSGLQSSNQAYLDNLLKQYQSGVSSPYDALNGLMGIIGTNNWGSQSSGNSTTETDPGFFGTIAGLLGTGTNAAKLFSDRRIKEDIVRVGSLDNGLPVYTFRYRGLPHVHMGLMAQDVEKSKPEAVDEWHGIKMVDYGLAAQ